MSGLNFQITIFFQIFNPKGYLSTFIERDYPLVWFNYMKRHIKLHPQGDGVVGHTHCVRLCERISESVVQYNLNCKFF